MLVGNEMQQLGKGTPSGQEEREPGWCSREKGPSLSQADQRGKILEILRAVDGTPLAEASARVRRTPFQPAPALAGTICMPLAGAAVGDAARHNATAQNGPFSGRSL